MEPAQAKKKTPIKLPMDFSAHTLGPSFASGLTARDEIEAFAHLLPDAPLADFLSLWLESVEGRPPGRDRFGPQRLKGHLGHVSVLEYLPEENDVAFRLVGTWLTEKAGLELKGIRIRTLFAEDDANFDAIWLPVFQEARPRLDVGTLRLPDGVKARHSELHLPVADANGGVRYSYFRMVVSAP